MVSGFGLEEATNFDQPATGKTISGFFQSKSRSDKIASTSHPRRLNSDNGRTVFLDLVITVSSGAGID